MPTSRPDVEPLSIVMVDSQVEVEPEMTRAPVVWRS
jgi:hypothetical protein